MVGVFVVYQMNDDVSSQSTFMHMIYVSMDGYDCSTYVRVEQSKMTIDMDLAVGLVGLGPRDLVGWQAWIPIKISSILE